MDAPLSDARDWAASNSIGSGVLSFLERTGNDFGLDLFSARVASVARLSFASAGQANPPPAIQKAFGASLIDQPMPLMTSCPWEYMRRVCRLWGANPR